MDDDSIFNIGILMGLVWNKREVIEEAARERGVKVDIKKALGDIAITIGMS